MTPELLTFGDGDHQIGESAVIITGLHFGVFPGNLGAVWISDNADIGAAGNTDKITTFNSWGNQYIDFDMPDPMNNTPGARFAFVLNDTGDWSFTFPFTLSAAAAAGSGGLYSFINRRRRYS